MNSGEKYESRRPLSPVLNPLIQTAKVFRCEIIFRSRTDGFQSEKKCRASRHNVHLDTSPNQRKDIGRYNQLFLHFTIRVL